MNETYKKKKRDFLHKQPKLKKRSTVKECWVGKKKKDFIIEVKNSQVRIGDLYKGKKKPKTSPPNMSNRKKKSGSQAANNQKQLLQSIQNCGCARTDTRTKKKKKTKIECQEHAFHFSESSFLFPFSFSNFPSQWLASSLHFSKYCLRKEKKKKKMLRSFTEGDTPLQS